MQKLPKRCQHEYDPHQHFTAAHNRRIRPRPCLQLEKFRKISYDTADATRKPHTIELYQYLGYSGGYATTRSLR